MPIKQQHQVQTLRGIACSVPEFAKLMNVTPNAIRALIMEGMPVYDGGGKGKSNVLSSADCIQWLRGRGFPKSGRKPKSETDPEPDNDPKRQMERLKLEQTEIELGRDRGELVSMSEMIPKVREAATQFRIGLLDIVRDFRELHGDEIAAKLERRMRATLKTFETGFEE